MAPEDIARFQQLMGLKVVKVGGVFWQEVRPFFFRPVWQFQELDPRTVVVPPRSRVGGCQFAVPAEAAANSQMNLYVFQNASEYTLARLARKPRKQVRLAADEFVIRPIKDLAEFKQQALPVYRSFYDRTRYRTRSERRIPSGFSAWSESLFRIPNVVILGGYRSGELGGVSLSFLVGDVVNYASFFCDTRALSLHLSDLMLHSIREAAAFAGVSQVFVGAFKGVRGLDDFKQLRGATLIHQRARLRINPVTSLLLRVILPGRYARAIGDTSGLLP